MRIRSYGELGVFGAVLFLLGWLSGSSLAPPVATTAGRIAEQPRAAPPPQVPRVERPAARPHVDPPRTRRNPFTFAAAVDRVAPKGAALAAVRTFETDEARDAAVATQAVPDLPWRMVGVASAADGTWTAIVTGGTDIYLVRLADTLPGGWAVRSVDPAGATLRGPDGVDHVLTLP